MRRGEGSPSPFRAYCRSCDQAVDARGAWPGRCTRCRTPVEADPVEDVAKPGLRVLFVGINPGVRTARARHHFANPNNTFWRLLHEAGFTPRRFAPGEERELLRLGVGITNVVTRATPGAADVTREDTLRGRERFASGVESARPAWLAFVGKQAWVLAGGARDAKFGAVKEPLLGRRAFVLPSTSPANAAISPATKLRWFRRLRQVTA